METITQGTLVADRYRMIREIGFGGMGTVWLAYDAVLASQCAIKLIGSTQAKHEEFRIRFECEAKCAAQLRGAHVVDVFNRGQWQGKPFIVMEYLEGEDLAMRLERVGRLEPRATYQIVAQVARALMRAHALGIVHRDIKPGNIFLVPGDDHEIAKVLDFGVAKHRALPNAFENPISGEFIGTPCYMSPEQASSGVVDSRSDLWALAVITFECLTGELPFQDECVLDMIQAITHGVVPSLRERRPELPPEVEMWWKRATTRDAQRRFQSAKELADALAEALGVYPMAVSAFPQASVEAPTVLDPLSIVPAYRRPALATHGANAGFVRRNAYETDAAVTLHADQPSSTARFEKALRRRRRASPYVVAASAVCVALALVTGVWRPALNGVASSLGFAAPSEAPPLPQTAGIRKDTEVSPAQDLTIVRAALSTELATASQPPVLTLAPGPTVVVTEARAPRLGSRPTAKKPGVSARKPNSWRPLAPPVPSLPPELPEQRQEKDYGI